MSNFKPEQFHIRDKPGKVIDCKICGWSWWVRTGDVFYGKLVIQCMRCGNAATATMPTPETQQTLPQ